MKLDLKKYKAFIFDFDGVIVDSLDIKTKAFGELFGKYGRDISQKVMDYHRNNGGISRYEKFKYYYRELLHKKIDQKIIDKLDKEYSDLVVKKVIAAPYIEGALVFIKRLKLMGRDCFIISGTPQKEIRRILKQKKIERLFRCAAGSPVDKTRNLKMIISRYRVTPGEAVYFGDARSDYEAAKDNKVYFVRIVRDRMRELSGASGAPKIHNFTNLIRF